MIIYTSRRGLNSVALLKENGFPIRYPSSTPRSSKAIAWGCSTTPPWGSKMEWVNSPDFVRVVSNKLLWSTAVEDLGMKNCNIKTTTDIELAKSWADTPRSKVLCRTIINGSGGEGIVIARTADEIVEAPLYSLYFRKTSELRIFACTSDGIFYCCSKRRPSSGPEMTRDQRLVRTLDSGYVYQREYIEELPVSVLTVCNTALALCTEIGGNMLFLDVAYDLSTNTARIIEVNSAPGLNEDSALALSTALSRY